MTALDSICTGESVRVVKIYLNDSMRGRLFDIGFTEGTEITCVGKSPSGDPYAFLVRGSVFALRKKDCKRIFVSREGV
ncbi:MAG: ferrous iron transport protein A [Oscillospiraceae bacterium]|nr:ferrous iron transport protein A [Oscillospiraceae bacterium]